MSGQAFSAKDNVLKKPFVDSLRSHLDALERLLPPLGQNGPEKTAIKEAREHLATLAEEALATDRPRAKEVCDIADKMLVKAQERGWRGVMHAYALNAVFHFLEREEEGMRLLAVGGEMPSGFQTMQDEAFQKVAKAIEGLEAATADDASNKSASALEPRQLKVLVVDDEDIIRNFLADVLDSAGHKVMTEMNGLAAIELLNHEVFDVVFTDIRMPGVDGIQVLRHAKRLCPDVEVVIITGYASLESAAQAVHHGAYDYLAKPFNGSANILGVVRRIQQAIALREENRRLMLELHQRNEDLKRYVVSLEDALKQVQEKQQALIHADRMASLGVLSAGVAHEINNPTTFIRGNLQTFMKFWTALEPFVENAVKDNPDNHQLEFACRETPGLIHDMLVGTERISKIVSGLRSFAHKGESHRQQTDIHNCIQEAGLLVANQMSQSGVKVEKDLCPNPPQLMIDPQQITQVFVNILINAMHALEGMQEPKIKISSRIDDTVFIVTVADNGCGMSKETQAKIFTPFFTTKPVGKGTGLGLSIVLGILNEHRGTVSVETDVGKGSAFSIHVPLQAPPQRDEEDKAKVLVADDDEGIRGVIQHVLSVSGRFEVETAAGGFQALRKVDSWKPDLLILDILMADVDGFKVMESLRSNPANNALKIIGMTGAMNKNAICRLNAIGVDSILLKPFGLDDVLRKVRELLEPDTFQPAT